MGIEWVIAALIVLLLWLTSRYARDDREEVVGAVLHAVADFELQGSPGTGDEVALWVESKLGRHVPVAEAYGVLLELRRRGLVRSEYQRAADEYREYGSENQLPMVWRVVDKESA